MRNESLITNSVQLFWSNGLADIEKNIVWL